MWKHAKEMQKYQVSVRQENATQMNQKNTLSIFYTQNKLVKQQKKINSASGKCAALFCLEQVWKSCNHVGQRPATTQKQMRTWNKTAHYDLKTVS